MSIQVGEVFLEVHIEGQLLLKVNLPDKPTHQRTSLPPLVLDTERIEGVMDDLPQVRDAIDDERIAGDICLVDVESPHYCLAHLHSFQVNEGQELDHGEEYGIV